MRSPLRFLPFLLFSLLDAACGTGSPGPSDPTGENDASAAAPPLDATAPPSPADAGVSTDASASDDAAMTEAGSVLDAAPPDPGLDAAPLDAGPPYDEAVFMATHNSYSGGARGPIPAQLDEGVRFVELDIHDDEFTTVGDYQVGHDKPGDQLQNVAPNPTSFLLRDWLGVVATWSAAHPTHAPIVVAFDLKSALTDNDSFAAGNPAALNAEVDAVLGAQLLAARDVATPWPGVDSLRGGVMVVLSGDEGTRRAYRLDQGAAVSVAMNAAGQVVEVHASAKGDLWYWTGAFTPAGGVRWQRHGKLGTGTSPAVALSDAGQLVEIHQSGSGALSYAVGVLGADLEITWQSAQSLGKGTKPTVRAQSGGPAVRAIWASGATTTARAGTFDATTPTIQWTAAAPTTNPPFDVARDANGARWVSVRTGADGLAGADTILYATATTPVDRVRYDQVAFVEFQENGDALLAAEARFYAAVATDTTWLASARSNGHVVRGWQFDDVSQATTPPETFPATDTPAAAWYVAYAQQIGAMQ